MIKRSFLPLCFPALKRGDVLCHVEWGHAGTREQRPDIFRLTGVLANSGHRSGDVARQGHLPVSVPGEGVKGRDEVVLEDIECACVQRFGHVARVSRD